MATLLACACARAANEPPRVLDIPFAVPASKLPDLIPANAKPTNYPLVPLYGYKLVYPNPGQWVVMVQEEAADELLEKSIFKIHIDRDLGRECNRQATKALADTLEGRYASAFDAAFVEPQEDSSYALVAASERRMLTAEVRCSLRDIGASLTYFDLDNYRYRQPDSIAKLISSTLIHAKSYPSRTF